jgi:hypothetical protein
MRVCISLGDFVMTQATAQVVCSHYIYLQGEEECLFSHVYRNCKSMPFSVKKSLKIGT